MACNVKTALFILTASFAHLFCVAQKPNKNDVPPESLDTIVYDLTQKILAPSIIDLPFSGIEILDARFDTSKLGYEVHRGYDLFDYKNFKRIKLANGIKNHLEFFYNDYYSLCFKNPLNRLLIVLKTLWINNVPFNRLKNNNSNEREVESFQDIHVKWEYYIKREGKYYPFKKVDTIYQLTENMLASKDVVFKKNDLSFFVFVLKSQLEQIDFSNINTNYENKRSLSISGIDSFNRKRLLVPVIGADKITTGVFQNFEEFKDNAPSVVDYKFTKKNWFGIWVDKKTLEPIKKIFLISDSIGIHTGAQKRMSVTRVGNTFEFFEFGYVTVSNTFAGNLLRMIPSQPYSPAYQSPLRFNTGNGANDKGILVPRQLNMETGEIY